MRSCIGPLVLLAQLSGAACSRESAPPAPTVPPPFPAAPSKAPGAAPEHSAGLPFIEDDWAEAKRQAMAGGKLVFVDAWAVWCHTCWSMKREVLHDASLAAFTDRFVGLEIDTDRPQNAAFTTRFPVRGWPTFFAIDPASEAIVAVQGGSMSLAETRAFLETSFLARSGGSKADQLLAQGYAALQRHDPATAATHFTDAAAAGGPRKSEALAATVRALREAKDFSRCASVGAAALDQVQGSATAGDLASLLMLCAGELKDVGAQTAARTAAQRTLERLVQTPEAGSAVDDHADVMANLAELYEGQGKKAEARALHEKRVALMEEDAAKAKTPLEARVHDFARMNSYIALDQGEKAVALFEQRIKELPDDYEAHARLASTLHQMTREADALPHAKRAVELSYGPRKLRYLKLLADIHNKLADTAGERDALTQLVSANGALDAGLQNADLAAKASARLAEIKADPSPP